MSHLNKRNSIRFLPDPDDHARIDIEMKGSEFTTHIIGLIADESAKGCGLVILSDERITTGVRCLVQVGKLAPLLAEVKWCKPVDERITRVGLLYLE